MVDRTLPTQQQNTLPTQQQNTLPTQQLLKHPFYLSRYQLEADKKAERQIRLAEYMAKLELENKAKREEYYKKRAEERLSRLKKT